MSRKIHALFLFVFVFYSFMTAMAGTPFFSPHKYLAGGPYTSALAVADVNGDGKLDVVVANDCGSSTDCSPPSSIGILLGNGDGTFQAVRTVALPGYRLYAISVAVADVNLDGKPDVLVAADCTVNPCPPNSLVGVLLGNGDGTFQDIRTYGSGGASADSLAVADVNGDGKPDVVVANLFEDCCTTSEGGVAVLLGNGDGTFQAAQTYRSNGYEARAIAATDVNTDGKLDLVVTNLCTDNTCGGTGNLSVLLGNGDGTFQAPQSFSSGGSDAISLQIADVNGDEKPDLLVANMCFNTSVCQTSVGVLLGNGDGTFQTAKTYDSGGLSSGGNAIAVADVNGDNKLDLLVANQLTPSPQPQSTLGVLLGNGDGTFETAQTYSANEFFPSSIAVGDVNDDRRLDVLVGSSRSCARCTIGGSVAVLLRRQFSTTMGVSTSATPVPPGQSVTLTAKVTPGYGTIPDGQIVTFHIGKADIGTATMIGGMATLTTSKLKPGTYIITATYAGNIDFKASSNGVQQAVEPYPSTTSLSSSPNPSAFGQRVQLTATVSSSVPGGPTGLVTFRNGATVLGTASLNPGPQSSRQLTFLLGQIH